MDASDRVAEGLITSGGRIEAVGTGAELRDMIDAGVEVVDLNGRVVVPGFVDAHCHLELTTVHLAYATQCFVPPHAGIHDICETIRGAAAQPGDDWIIGRSNMSLQLFAEERRPITRADIDAVAPDRPVVVFSGVHFATLNTRALQVTGLLDGAELPRGSSIDLESGRGTELWDWLPFQTFGVDACASAIERLGAEMFRSRGVTSVGEIPFSHDGIRAFQKLHREGRLPMRLDLRYPVPRICSVDQLAALGFETGFGDEWLAVGGIKLFVDGAGSDVHGNLVDDLKWSQAELDEAVLQAHLAGLQLMMHVQSEHSLDMALRALERALKRAPQDDHRHRIEHAADLPAGDEWFERIASLGVVAVATPQFIYSFGDAFPESSDPRLRTLRGRGHRIPGNSDSTGSQPEAANPFHGIWCAIERRTRNGTQLSPDEALSVRDALRMFTADAAFACRMDDRGVLAPGKLADFVVLGEDPEQVPTGDLPQLPIDQVVLDGTPV